MARAAALGLGVVALVLARPVGQVLAAARARAAPRRAWLAPSRGGGRRLRRRGDRPARRARRRSTRRAPTTSPSSAAARRRFSSARSSRTASSQAGQRLCVRGARASSVARAAPARALPVARDRPRDVLLAPGSSRMHDDLTVLSDRTWGWDDDYRHLGRVAREAIRAHPGAYARGVAKDIWRLLLWPRVRPVDGDRHDARPAPGRSRPRRRRRRTRDGRRADPVLARGAVHLHAGRADPRGVDVADRAFDRLPHPADAARSAALDREVDALLSGLPGPCRPPLSRRAPQRRLAPLPAAVHVAAGRHRRRPLAAPEAGSPFQSCSPRRRSR